MYSFVYWFFYKFFLWRKGYESSFLSSAMVGVVLTIHLGLIHSIIRYNTGWTIGTFSNDYSANKLLLLPFVLLFYSSLDFVYFRQRREVILEKYSEKKPFSIISILLVSLIIIIPLIIAIKITNISVEKFG